MEKTGEEEVGGGKWVEGDYARIQDFLVVLEEWAKGVARIKFKDPWKKKPGWKCAWDPLTAWRLICIRRRTRAAIEAMALKLPAAAFPSS